MFQQSMGDDHMKEESVGAPFLFLMATYDILHALMQYDMCSFRSVKGTGAFSNSSRKHVSWWVCDSTVS